MMNEEQFEQRAKELEQPITEWIQMTDNPQDLIILSFVMMSHKLTHLKPIFFGDSTRTYDAGRYRNL